MDISVVDDSAVGDSARNAKLKSIKNGDTVQINGEVFQVRAVEPQEGSRNISLELQAHDGGSVTFIGLPKAKVQLAARAS
ncbi:hypothetical protein CQ020_13145 [Arthrobacter sp. MYb23]|uniref:hypothetical protein n=1 Tax=unclassified Arthrobacter TaxID=235627 RepID=UPI000CFBD197|nr:MULTISPECIES: hypothetical protein [unclassified Arthrobacter]PRB42049.1 hypothetical protein CQ038_11150 [Arthrobacter sp. MYb51]PRB95252.1 hypothetical protein CQ020_13145 [Arthrobacter sp. MYb23]